MQVGPNSTIADAISQLETEIEERKQLVSLLRQFLTGVSASRVTLAVQVPTSFPTATVAVANGNGSDKAAGGKRQRGVLGRIPAEGTRARRAYDILLAAETPLSQPQIREKFIQRGFKDTYDERFLTKIFTALSRHPKIFTRLSDKTWVLTSRLSEFSTASSGTSGGTLPLS
jgi:hypothetical protein